MQREAAASRPASVRGMALMQRQYCTTESAAGRTVSANSSARRSFRTLFYGRVPGPVRGEYAPPPPRQEGPSAKRPFTRLRRGAAYEPGQARPDAGQGQAAAGHRGPAVAQPGAAERPHRQAQGGPAPNPADRAMADPADSAAGGNRRDMYFELAIPNGRGMVGHAKGLAAWPIGSSTEGWRSGRLRPSGKRLISL